jgi:hypothetical protein
MGMLRIQVQLMKSSLIIGVREKITKSLSSLCLVGLFLALVFWLNFLVLVF